MKNFITLIFLTLSYLAGNSQSVYFGLGKTLAKLTFKDTEGNSLGGLKGSQEGTFYLGGRYPLFKTAFHISGDASYQRYLSEGSDPVLGNYYAWDATFAGANLGFDYEIHKPNFAYYKKQAFSFCLKTSLGAEFLMDGTQNVNNQISNLKGADEYDQPFYFVRGGASVNFYFSKEICAFVQYMGGKSILFGDYTNKQQAAYVTHSITVGVAYNLLYTNVSNK